MVAVVVAVELLRDRVFTIQSDVQSFGSRLLEYSDNNDNNDNDDSNNNNVTVTFQQVVF